MFFKPSILVLGILAVSSGGSVHAQPSDQKLQIDRFNTSEWTKGRFTEVVTVNGPGTTIYVAGVGAEDEKAPAGASASILFPGYPYAQCKYAYDKIRRALAAHGGSLADVVKQVVYVVDVRFQVQVGKCRSEEYGSSPIPANTFLVVSGLAIPGMLLEIDVTAVVDTLGGGQK